MSKRRKIVSDDLLLNSSVYQLDSDTQLLASQAAMVLGRSKTRMDSDRREGRPPKSYRDRTKVLYRLGDVLAERTRLQHRTRAEADRERDAELRGWPTLNPGSTLLRFK